MKRPDTPAARAIAVPRASIARGRGSVHVVRHLPDLRDAYAPDVIVGTPTPPHAIVGLRPDTPAVQYAETTKELTRMPLIDPGKKAPAFTLKDQSGKTHKLADYAGRPVILYFYPKDDTPGCTKEACSFRDNLPKFK